MQNQPQGYAPPPAYGPPPGQAYGQPPGGNPNEIRPDPTGGESWHGEASGIIRDYTGQVLDSYYGIDEEYSKAAGKQSCFFYVVVRDVASGIDRTEKLGTGEGWMPIDGGNRCYSPEGRTRFSTSTVLGSFLDDAMKKWGVKNLMVAKHGFVPLFTEGKIWRDMVIKFGKSNYKGMKGEHKERTIPVKLLGWAGQNGVPQAPAVATPPRTKDGGGHGGGYQPQQGGYSPQQPPPGYGLPPHNGGYQPQQAPPGYASPDQAQGYQPPAQQVQYAVPPVQYAPPQGYDPQQVPQQQAPQQYAPQQAYAPPTQQTPPLQAPVGGGAALVDQRFRELAAKHPTFENWQKEAMTLPELAQDPASLNRITDRNYYDSIKPQ